MAAGVYTTVTEGAGARQRGVTPNVLFADTYVLSALDACNCGVAQLRFCERTCTRHVPATANPAPGRALPPANLAPDIRKAAVRDSMTTWGGGASKRWSRTWRMPVKRLQLRTLRHDCPTRSSRRLCARRRARGGPLQVPLNHWTQRCLAEAGGSNVRTLLPGT